MTINIDLPQPIEDKLRRNLVDLSKAGKQAMLVGLYRQGNLSHHELGVSLGLTRLETDAVLNLHRVTEDLLTPEDWRVRDSLELESLFGPNERSRLNFLRFRPARETRASSAGLSGRDHLLDRDPG